MDLSNTFNSSSENKSEEISPKTNNIISIDSINSAKILYKILSNNPLLLNTYDDRQETFLSYAIKRNNKEIIDLILSSPLLNLKYTDKNGNTYLHIAIIQKNLEAAESLIKKGISINEKNKDGNTPLHLAYYLNFTEIIKLLIKNNADITIKNNKGYIAEEIIPTNEIDKIAGYEVQMNFDENLELEDELKFDKVYQTIETSEPYKYKEIKNRKQSIKNKKNSFFNKTGKGYRKISAIAWKFNENDRFIRKESEAYPFYIELIDSKTTNTSEENISNNNNKIKRKKSLTVVNKILYEFLIQIKMEKYYNNFNISILSNINKIIEETKINNKYIKEKDLKNIGINIPGDRAKILIKIEEKANKFDFDIPKAVYYIKENLDINEKVENDKNLYKLYLWLRDINLDIYFFNFVNNGYFSIDLLYIQMGTKNPLTEETLKNEIGYRMRIMNKLLEEYPDYLNKLKNSVTDINSNKISKMCNNCSIF